MVECDTQTEVEQVKAKLTREQSQALTLVMSREAYLKSYEITCPNCDGWNTTTISPIIPLKDVTPRRAMQTLICRLCSFCWEDHYQLVDMIPIKRKVLK